MGAMTNRIICYYARYDRSHCYTAYIWEYDRYDTYYKCPTRQTTYHDAWMDKFKACKRQFHCYLIL